MNSTIDEMIEDVVEGYLEDYSLEDFLEEFDITPVKAVQILFDGGHLDQTLMEKFLTGE